MLNKAILICGISSIASLFLLVGALGASGSSAGCYIIGSEVNGDFSVEYIGIGNC